MRRLATLPVRRLWAIAAAVLLVAAGAGVAQAALSGSPKPAPKPLDAAVRDALNAPAVPGVTARIRFSNHLLPSGAAGRGGPTPLIAGATGRLWLANDGRVRLELQSENGDAQIVSDGKTLTVYDATSNTVYKAALPAEQRKPDHADHGPVTLAAVDKGLSRLAQSWHVSGARPTSTAGRPSYTVQITPKDDGGLLGAAQVAWDAARGVPLRAAVYAQGQSSPVVELTATDISYGKVAASTLRATPPAGAKVVELKSPGGHARAAHGAGKRAVSGAARVARQLDFPLSAPAKLAGLPRQDVRLLSLGEQKGALATYGRGLGAIAVVQRKADPGDKGNQGAARDLPKINIDGATGTELATALGTVVTFERNGVSYVVAGSVPPVAAENAARGLR